MNQYAVDNIADVTTQNLSIINAENIVKILFDRDRVASALQWSDKNRSAKKSYCVQFWRKASWEKKKKFKQKYIH